VREADVDSLISLLSNDKYPDLEFQKIFLLTYRSFISTKELLQKLILRYDAWIHSVDAMFVVY
jgi:hypothetical protein